MTGELVKVSEEKVGVGPRKFWVRFDKAANIESMESIIEAGSIPRLCEPHPTKSDLCVKEKTVCPIHPLLYQVEVYYGRIDGA